MAKFPQRITAIVTLDVHDEGLTWATATAAVTAALMDGSGIHDINLKRVTALESLDGEDQDR